MGEELQISTPTTVVPPNGMYPGRLDDKGRMKLPACMLTFLQSFGDKTFFVTSTNRSVAQIYPNSIWRQNQVLLSSNRDKVREARNVLFNASDLGADAEIDNQGRITFNTELRRELGLEGVGLRLVAVGERIDVLTDGIYQSRRALASVDPVRDVEAMEGLGLR